MKPEKFDFEDFVRQAGDQLRSGKPLTGAEGVFTPLLKRILEASLEGELDNHLQETRTKDKNRRNGYSAKNLSSSLGSLEIFAPRDRNASFEPQIIEKRQRSLSEDIDKKILSLYGRDELRRYPRAPEGDVRRRSIRWYVDCNYRSNHPGH